MKVSDILRVKGSTLYTVAPDEPLARAIETMADKDIGSLEHFAYDIFQFADIARPGLRLKELHRVGMDCRLRHAQNFPVLLQKVINELRNIFAALSQRREANHDRA